MIKLYYSSKEKNIKAIIEEDSSVGFYLYVWEMKSNKGIFDNLQDTLEIAKEEAKEDFGIPKNEWKPFSNEENNVTFNKKF